MTTVLFFDTETTGKTVRGGDLEDQPRIVQLAAILAEVDECGNLHTAKTVDTLFNPTVPIPAEASAIHGITTEMVRDKPEFRTYAAEFVRLVKSADVVVAHNAAYDLEVLSYELWRIYANHDAARLAWERSTRAKIHDTMLAGTDLCKIPGPYGYKWPKLAELHRYLFNRDFENAHDALGDITATMACYAEMVRRGLFSLPLSA